MQSSAPVGLPVTLKIRSGESIFSFVQRHKLENSLFIWDRFKKFVPSAGKEGLFFFNSIDDLPVNRVMLQALGLQYADAVQHHTQHFYWLGGSAFKRSGEPMGVVDDVRTFVSLNNIKTPISSCASLRMLGFQMLRWCHHCVREDLNRLGSTHWRVTQQLPTSYACIVHRSPLRSVCIHCKLPPKVLKDGSPGFARLVCHCGLSLHNYPEIESSPTLIAAAIFGDAMLGNADPSWNYEDANAVAVRTADAFGRRTNLLDKIVENFQHGKNAIRGTLEITFDSADMGGLKFRSVSSFWNSKDYVLLFSALGVKYEEFRRLVISQGRKSITFENLDLSVADESIASARTRMQKYSGNLTWRQRVTCRDCKFYWVLKILDSGWLASNFPWTARVSLPSVERDRTSISNNLEDICAKKRLTLNKNACLRAEIRDGDWFRSSGAVEVKSSYNAAQHEGAAVDRKSSVSNTKLATQLALKKNILDVIALLQTSHGEPLKISCLSISKKMSCSYGEVRQLVSTDAELKALLLSLQSSCYERRVAWAVEQLTANSQATTVRNVAALIGRQNLLSAIMKRYRGGFSQTDHVSSLETDATRVGQEGRH